MKVSFVRPGDTQVENMNRTYVFEKDRVKRSLIMMRDRLQELYGYKYPVHRRVMEDRLNFLEKEVERWEYMINPYHIQPGLLLDVDITSIKRKKGTLDGMANVLNEFLHGVSKGFQDAAFANFSRRRSTIREDIAQSFGPEEEIAEQAGTSEAELQAMLEDSEGNESSGMVDSEPKSKRKSRSKNKSDSGLKEI